MKYRLTLRTASPVAVSSLPDTGNQNISPGYIPGSALRGALAQHYLVENGEADDNFKMLFVDGRVQFPNLYPAKGQESEVGVLPMSARTCKRFQGFGNSPSEHGMSDMLMASATMAVDKDPGPLKELENCRQKDCAQPLARCEKEFFRRFPRGQSGQEGQLHETARADRRLMARVGIDGLTGTSSPGILYSLDVINEGQLFTGDIHADKETSELLCHFLKPGVPVYAGQARSRGLGLMEVISFDLLPDQDNGMGGVAERLAKFNKVLSGFLNVNQSTYFSLDLQSDAIIQDVFMRYLDCLPVAELAQYLGLPEERLKLVWSVSEMTPARGWNDAHKMFKPGEFGVRRGSVFLYRYDGDTSELDLALASIEEKGIGNRRDEGYGRVIVCNPFHWEVSIK